MKFIRTRKPFSWIAAAPPKPEAAQTGAPPAAALSRKRKRPRQYALSPNEANKRQERFDRWMQWWFQNSGSVHSSLRELERHPDANIRGLAQVVYDPTNDELLHAPETTGVLADLLEDIGHPHAQIYRDWYEHSIANDRYHDEPQQLSRPRRGADEMREDFSKRPRKRDRERRRKRDERDRWSGFWARHKPQLSQHFAELTAHPNANITRMAQELSESRHTPNVDLTGVLADALADEGHPSEPFFREWYNYAKTPYEGREDFSRGTRRGPDEVQELSRRGRRTPRHGPVKLNRPRRYNKQLPRPEEVLPQLRALEPLPPQSRYEQSALYQELSPQPGEHGGWFWQPTGRTYNARYDDVPMLPHVRQGGLVLAKHISSQVRHPEIARRLLTYIYHKNIPNKLFSNHTRQETEDIDPALAKMVQEYQGSTAPYSEGFYKDWEGLTNAHDTAGIMADYADDIGQEAIARRAREDWHRVNREVDETIQNTPYLREQRRKYAQQVGRRAPPGGIIFRGLHYPGGRYMPSKRYLAQLSKHDKLALPRAAGPWSHLS